MERPRKQKLDRVKSLAENVARLSQLLTRERNALPQAYLQDHGLREAYNAYFLPVNARKMRVPLRELALHPSGPLSKERLRILDIGSGPGSALLGVTEFFSEREARPLLEVIALDQVAGNLRAAEEFFIASRDRSGLDATLQTVQADIENAERLLSERFDLILLSNVLNELFSRHHEWIVKRAALLTSLLNKLLAEDGSCIIIEPALRETSRDMLEVRGELLDRGFHVYSPCLGKGKCPALENPKDWCHEDLAWKPPEIIQEIDRLIGLRKDSLKFSYLVLRKDALSLLDVFGKDAFRVVSEPLVSKGKRELFICGTGGRRLCTRLDKDATTQNRAFETLKRGDVVRFEGLLDEGKRLKVGKETAVENIIVKG
jgi:ribosomal protein RSM22 (predicted rRNA methylase)